MNNFDLVSTAKIYGTKVHKETNHMYGIHPYEYHLEKVYENVCYFAHLLKTEKEVEIAMAAAWVHDAIEDARQTYNDVVANVGVEVAEVAYALTNLKGKTRAERASDAYYAGIVDAGPVAILVKLCDRMANMAESTNTKNRMAKMYKKELPNFFEHLLPTKELKEQFFELTDLFNFILEEIEE